jgi:small redox-active disulfide protein 2
MKDIEILGSGCNNCKVLEQRVNAALREAGVEATVTMAADPVDIAALGMRSTPGLVVDGAVVASGRVPRVRALADLLR